MVLHKSDRVDWTMPRNLFFNFISAFKIYKSAKKTRMQRTDKVIALFVFFLFLFLGTYIYYRNAPTSPFIYLVESVMIRESIHHMKFRQLEEMKEYFL